MVAIIHPLLTLLASLTRQELARQVTYLKAENKILRSKLPDRITLNNQERRRLVRHGKRKWTIKGMVDLYFLVFIHIGTRRIRVSPCTANPTGEWTTQQDRNFDMFLQEENLPCAILQRDQDTKYVQAFDDVFTGDGRTIKKTPIKSPNLQAFVERVIQTLKHEVLNGFCVINEKHLDYLLKVGTDWYNNRRGHSARDHLPPIRDNDMPPTVDLTKQKLVCVEELGGQLKSYRAAA